MRKWARLVACLALATYLSLAAGHDAAADILWFSATGGRHAITLGWETFTEVDTLGYHLYRAAEATGPRTRLNASLIPPLTYPGSPFGSVYSYPDQPVAPGVPNFYWLERVTLHGGADLHGPVDAVARWAWQVCLPMVLAGP